MVNNEPSHVMFTHFSSSPTNSDPEGRIFQKMLTSITLSGANVFIMNCWPYLIIHKKEEKKKMKMKEIDR